MPIIRLVDEIKMSTIQRSKTCEMDTKVQVKQEDTPSGLPPQTKREFFTKHARSKTNSDTVLLDDSNLAVKTEIKSECSFPDFCAYKKRESFAEHQVKQIKYESVTCNKHCEIDTKMKNDEQTLFSAGSNIEGEFLMEDHIMNTLSHSSDHNVDNKIEIKEELWWLEGETLPVSDDIKDVDILPIKLPRLCTAALSEDGDGKSSSPCSKELRNTSRYTSKNHSICENQKNNIEDIPTVEKCSCAEKAGKCSKKRKISSSVLSLKQKCKYKRPHKCKICDSSFTRLPGLRRHMLVHTGEKPHKCKICEKNFAHFSSLKRHILIHTGVKPHKCQICDKSFSDLSASKRHASVHTGEKPHTCEICDKSFAQLSQLRKHTLVHTGERPYMCEVCERSFAEKGTLKKHILIHIGERPYICNICGTRFTQLTSMKMHTLIHTTRKPHKCGICDRRFKTLSRLKRHTSLHMAVKKHKLKDIRKALPLSKKQ